MKTITNITVEDCANKLGISKFDLSVLAAQRARVLCLGAKKLVELDPTTKPILVALEEIRTGAITMDDIIESLKTADQYVGNPVEDEKRILETKDIFGGMGYDDDVVEEEI